jgi:hypothetical protein
MLAFIMQHQVWAGIIGYWLFNALVGALPDLTSSSGPAYSTVYRFLHTLAGNLSNAFGNKIPGLKALGIVFLILCLGFTSTACTPSAINALNAAVSAAEVALPVILAATGVDPATATLAGNWLSAAVTIIDDLISKPAITAQDLDKAIADYQALGQPNVPPGNVANVLAGVTKAFKVFVDNYQGASVVTTASQPFTVFTLNAANKFPKHRLITIDTKTKNKLGPLHARIQDIKRRLGK